MSRAGPAIPRPAPTEYSSYFAAYVSAVPDGDLLQMLAEQHRDTERLLAGIPEARGLHRYAPGKWTIKDVVGHLADSERVFCYRALRFARADATPLPSFEQDDWVAAANAGARPLAELAAEFDAVRDATIALFSGLDAAAIGRRGVASGKEISVRALAWIIAGHERHHVKILRERYLA